MTILVSEGYRCILMDPPWPERGGGRIKRGADRYYDLMSPADILRVVLTSSCWSPDPYGCHLWVWTTNNWLQKGGMWLIDALGFRYVTNAVWVKPKAGLGQYLRGKHEHLLFAVKGKHLGYRAKDVTTELIGCYRGHSWKPMDTYSKIEAVSHGPRLEMFARSRREGWDSHGDEIRARFVRTVRSRNRNLQQGVK